MISFPNLLQVPRPRKFLYIMSLRTGAEMISLSLLFNKASGFYGLLALVTGFRLDATQLSMYIYSLGGLALLAILMPHIRKQSPLQNLALAWFYLFDTIINIAYTAAFGVTWFLTVSATHSDTTGGVPSSAPGSGTIDDTAGFTSPKYNVSEVEIVASPAAGIKGGETAVAIGAPATATAVGSATAAAVAAAGGNPSVSHGIQLAESLPSILLIVFLMIVRVYFVIIMMAWARQVVRGYVQNQSGARGALQDVPTEEGKMASPFAVGTPLGQGWRGRLGRIMVNVGKGYWLGTFGVDDEDWAKNLRGRFAERAVPIKREAPGNAERERRARAGTGPPRPSGEVVSAGLQASS